jgi:delta24-sterol reductase
LLARGLMLECCLEMEDATLGGLAMAQGMTTHSHVCGLLSETATEYEVVTADGATVVATAGT